jgi:hypothetical protein
MASNDDSNTILEIMKIGLPAAIFATTGRSEIIEKKSNYLILKVLINFQTPQLKYCLFFFLFVFGDFLQNYFS